MNIIYLFSEFILFDYINFKTNIQSTSHITLK